MSFEVKMVKNNKKGNVLDPQVKVFLNQLIEMNMPALANMSPSRAREFAIDAAK
ncbi:hypothetical protein MYX76_10025 [Desulfobacterota bacterium AH_259_B03_O07]|nr:hypothetical protein [Desulfobacterota bacterium AH_259_B03_O07]